MKNNKLCSILTALLSLLLIGQVSYAGYITVEFLNKNILVVGDAMKCAAAADLLLWNYFRSVTLAFMLVYVLDLRKRK